MMLTDKERRLQGHRKRMTSLSMVNWTLQSFVICLFAWTGQLSWRQAAISAVLCMGLGAVFHLLVASHQNLRLRDPGMLMPQVVGGFAVQLALIALIPKLWVLFLLGTIVSYNFAMLNFTPRQFTATGVGLGLGIGTALFIGRDGFGFPDPSGLTMLIFWLMFMLALSRLSVVGAQFCRLRDQLREKNRLLSDSVAHIERLASHDDLTGAYNRRAFMLLLAEERDRAARTGQSFCVALFDLDHFKLVNDRFGHSIGDEVLRRFSDTVRGQMRNTDRFGRYGGEEFVLLLTATTPAEVAATAVQRICRAVADAGWTALAGDLAITVSAGLACHRPDEPIESILERADRAMYEAKDKGRNQCVIAS